MSATQQLSGLVASDSFHALPDQIRDHASEMPDNVALVEGDTRLTWSELCDKSETMAKRLIHLGLRPGDVAAVLGHPQADYVIVFIAVLMAGGCVAPLTMMASDTALTRILADSGSRMLISTHSEAQRATTLLAASPSNSQVMPVALDFQADDWETLLHKGPISEVTLPDQRAEALFNIIYSSGTTGVPKGIVHDNLYRYRQIERMRSFGLAPGKVVMTSTAMYSNTTLTPALAALGCGATLVVLRKFSTQGFIAAVQENGVTFNFLVPTLVMRLLADDRFQAQAMPSLERTIVASSPFAPSVKKEALERWPGRLFEMYGMTEGGLTTMLDTVAHRHKLGSVGPIAKGATARIIDENGREVPTGQVGEVIGNSPTMMKGYHNRPDLAATTWIEMPDGLKYFRTGDLGRLDEDGFLYIVGRAKDVIISGGFNIYATDLEDALLSHPDVKEAAVMGMPNLKWGETPVAGVVLKDGARVGTTDLISFANNMLGKTQRISALEIVPALPLNAVGKVVKSELETVLESCRETALHA